MRARRIEKNAVARKVNTMKRDLQDDLEQRRGRLARMLAEEDAQYTRELESMEETPEVRRDKLRARARELIRRREQEKREFANQMLERQFREDCDAFRVCLLLHTNLCVSRNLVPKMIPMLTFRSSMAKRC